MRLASESPLFSINTKYSRETTNTIPSLTQKCNHFFTFKSSRGVRGGGLLLLDRFLILLKDFFIETNLETFYLFYSIYEVSY